MLKVLKFQSRVSFPRITLALAQSKRTEVDTSRLTKYKKLNFDYENRVGLFDLVNLDDVLPKYKNAENINEANERVKKILSYRFAARYEKLENLFLKHYEVLKRFDGDMDSEEVKIIKLTLLLRSEKAKLREIRLHKTKVRRHEDWLLEVAQLRNTLLWELRQLNFERYAKVMNELDLTFTLPAAVPNVRLTMRMRDIADMKIRTFAQIKKTQEILESRKAELAEKEKEFEEKIRSGEIQIS